MATIGDDPAGGEAACWAHLFPDDEDHDREIIDLMARVEEAAFSGPVWTCESDDLDVNLLVFPAGDGVGEHVNAEIDVLLLGIAGAGVVAVDGLPRVLRAGQAMVIRKGARRGTQAVSDPFAYLTCHRRRAGLWPSAGG